MFTTQAPHDDASRLVAPPPMFHLGQVVATPGALALLTRHNQLPVTFLHRHVFGDWGELCQADVQANTEALSDDSRLFSSYCLGAGVPGKKGERLWVITDAGHRSGASVTTLLLPDDY